MNANKGLPDFVLEFVVGLSASFPQNYVSLNQASWTVTVVGTNDTGWEDPGSSSSVTGDSALQPVSTQVQVLGPSFALSNHMVPTP